jgi:hypothetical protein
VLLANANYDPISSDHLLDYACALFNHALILFRPAHENTVEVAASAGYRLATFWCVNHDAVPTVMEMKMRYHQCAFFNRTHEKEKETNTVCKLSQRFSYPDASIRVLESYRKRFLPTVPGITAAALKTMTCPQMKKLKRDMLLRCHPDKVRDASKKDACEAEFKEVEAAWADTIDLCTEYSRFMEHFGSAK